MQTLPLKSPLPYTRTTILINNCYVVTDSVIFSAILSAAFRIFAPPNPFVTPNHKYLCRNKQVILFIKNTFSNACANQ